MNEGRVRREGLGSEVGLRKETGALRLERRLTMKVTLIALLLLCSSCKKATDPVVKKSPHATAAAGGIAPAPEAAFATLRVDLSNR